jgi:hypothetical protein
MLGSEGIVKAALKRGVSFGSVAYNRVAIVEYGRVYSTITLKSKKDSDRLIVIECDYDDGKCRLAMTIHNEEDVTVGVGQRLDNVCVENPTEGLRYRTLDFLMLEQSNTDS